MVSDEPVVGAWYIKYSPLLVITAAPLPLLGVDAIVSTPVWVVHNERGSIFTEPPKAHVAVAAAAVGFSYEIGRAHV